MGTWLKRIGLGALALVVLCTVAVFAVDAHGALFRRLAHRVG